MRHVRSFKNLNESVVEYYNIIDIKEALESMENNSESYFIINMDDHDAGLDYYEDNTELRITTELSDYPGDYLINMAGDQVSSDLFDSIVPSEETPLFTFGEIEKAIDDAIDNNDDGINFVRSIYTGRCSINWVVNRGRSSTRQLHISAEIEGVPEIDGVNWGEFVNSVIRELGSSAAGKITYS